ARVEDIPDEDLTVLGFGEFSDALQRGIAAHHAGMLPLFKETVEQLFSEGLVKVVFATETLALGINMPARSAVLEPLVKWKGDALPRRRLRGVRRPPPLARGPGGPARAGGGGPTTGSGRAVARTPARRRRHPRPGRSPARSRRRRGPARWRSGRRPASRGAHHRPPGATAVDPRHHDAGRAARAGAAAKGVQPTLAAVPPRPRLDAAQSR